MQHERPALTAPHGSKELFKHGAFRRPANKPHGTSSAHRQRRPYVLILHGVQVIGVPLKAASRITPAVGHRALVRNLETQAPGTHGYFRALHMTAGIASAVACALLAVYLITAAA
jgi:hypothetical protein